MKKNLFEKLLDYYHITYDDYIHLTRDVSLNDLPSPFNFNKMDEAVDLVKKHLQKGDKIVIYGDYDADGITGCSILVKMFKYLNFDANYYIPSRYLDGYGINEKKAQEIIDKGYDLVITVDNGVAANEAIALLRNANIDVLVLDHHEPRETLPSANVIIHPILSNYSITPSSGAFTAFMFASALLGYYDKYLATLASISLISDMMPLRDYNRDLLRAVIKEYRYGEFPQIDYLIEDGGFNDTSIGMSIAPKINAVGRIDKTINVNRLIKYFTSDKEEEIISYKDWILANNEIRKNKSKEAKENIINNLKEYHEPSLVIECDLEEGLIGLVANALMNQLKIPCVVLCNDSADPKLLKGSARSIEGFNIAEAFNKLDYLLTNHGGHALAAGLTIDKNNVETFKKEFNEIVKSTKIEKKDKEVVDLNINDISIESYRLIETFSPFGEEWKAPLFSLKHVKVDSLMYSRNQDHIITSISPEARIMGFNYSKEMMSEYRFIDVTGTLRLNDFKGKKYVEFVINKLSESK